MLGQLSELGTDDEVSEVQYNEILGTDGMDGMGICKQVGELMTIATTLERARAHTRGISDLIIPYAVNAAPSPV